MWLKDAGRKVGRPTILVNEITRIYDGKERIVEQVDTTMGIRRKESMDKQIDSQHRGMDRENQLN